MKKFKYKMPTEKELIKEYESLKQRKDNKKASLNARFFFIFLIFFALIR